MGFTRFRAYQLGEEGSSFSYSHDGHFTLIEARLTELSVNHVFADIQNYGNGILDVLHITSWDKDHCNASELRIIINKLKPKRIKYPGYPPHTGNAEESLAIIQQYTILAGTAVSQSPSFIDGLPFGQVKKYADICYWPFEIRENSNDNSSIKLFRRGHFTVLSLGDVESPDIADLICRDQIIRNEVDIMILAHHGADNGFTSNELLSWIEPRIAICTSNYDNQYEHPKQEIRDLLHDFHIPLFTTKTGDVIIQTDSQDGSVYKAVNFICGNEVISSVKRVASKTY